MISVIISWSPINIRDDTRAKRVEHLAAHELKCQLCPLCDLYWKCASRRMINVCLMCAWEFKAAPWGNTQSCEWGTAVFCWPCHRGHGWSPLIWQVRCSPIGFSVVLPELHHCSAGDQRLTPALHLCPGCWSTDFSSQLLTRVKSLSWVVLNIHLHSPPSSYEPPACMVWHWLFLWDCVQIERVWCASYI